MSGGISDFRDMIAATRRSRRRLAEAEVSTKVDTKMGEDLKLADWKFLNDDTMLRGETIDTVIDTWMEHFERGDAQLWVEARCWLPEAAVALRDAGVTPVQAATIHEAQVGSGDYRDTLGYKVSCGDLSVEEAVKLAEEMQDEPNEKDAIKARWNELEAEAHAEQGAQFMEPQLVHDDYWSVDTPEGTHFMPYGDFPDEDSVRDTIDGEIWEIELQQGWLARLSASGYMDQTEWSPIRSVEDVDSFFDMFVWMESKQRVAEGQKRFRTQLNVGRSKYTVSYHDGEQTHDDGSDFFGIRIFKNKKEFEAFQDDLRTQGYIEESKKRVAEADTSTGEQPDAARPDFVGGVKDVDGPKGGWPLHKAEVFVKDARDAFAAAAELRDALKPFAAVRHFDPAYDGEKYVVRMEVSAEDPTAFEAMSRVASLLTVEHEIALTEAAGTSQEIQDRLEYLRGEIEAERISYGELAELQDLADYIDPGDTLLLQWAGVPEFDEDTTSESRSLREGEVLEDEIQCGLAIILTPGEVLESNLRDRVYEEEYTEEQVEAYFASDQPTQDYLRMETNVIKALKDHLEFRDEGHSGHNSDLIGTCWIKLAKPDVLEDAYWAAEDPDGWWGRGGAWPTWLSTEGFYEGLSELGASALDVEIEIFDWPKSEDGEMWKPDGITESRRIGETKEYILWAIPQGSTDELDSKPIFTQGKSEADVDRIKEIAAKDGWHTFRVQILDTEKPLDVQDAFAKAVNYRAENNIPGQGPTKGVYLTYEVYTDESIENDDASERGFFELNGPYRYEEFEDEIVEPMEPDEFDMDEGITAVDKAVEWLNTVNSWESSGGGTASDWLVGLDSWKPYESPAFFENDDEIELRVDAHFQGFTDEEVSEIHDKLKAAGNLYASKSRSRRVEQEDDYDMSDTDFEIDPGGAPDDVDDIDDDGGPDEENLQQRRLADPSPEYNPGDAVTLDVGEGPFEAVIADGDDDKPYRKEIQLWGELDTEAYLLRITDEESGESFESYFLSSLIR